MDDGLQEMLNAEGSERNHMELSDAEMREEEKTVTPQQNINNKQYISYKSMLLGVNGDEDDHSSNLEGSESDEEDSGNEMHDNDINLLDPLCPFIPITTEERKNLCRPWKRAIINKLLGRRIGYRTLVGRLSKLWNLTGNFELIDLHNDFFLV